MKSSVLVCTSVLVLGFSSISAQAVSFCYDYGEQYPWILKNEKGLHIFIMENTSAEVGESFELRPMPWKDCLRDLKEGTVNGAIAASYSQERAEFAVYPMKDGKPDASRRINTDGYSLLRLKGSKLTWDGKKLSNLSGPIGTQAAYSVNADLKKLGAEVDSNADIPETLLRRFGSGQFQAIALATGQAKKTMQSPYIAGKVELVTPPLSEKHYYLVFGKGYYKNNVKSVDKIWAAIKKVRESAPYKAKEASMALSN